MTGLKTLNDVADAAVEGEGGPSTSSGRAEEGGPEPMAETAVVAVALAERDAALARADQAETDYLNQSNTLAATNAALAKAEGALKEALEALDAAAGTRAGLEAQVQALGAKPPSVQPVVKVKRPKPGAVLVLPEEGARAKGAAVAAVLADGGVLMLVLLDDAGAVQAYPAQVGGLGMFSLHSPESSPAVVYAPAIELTADKERCEVRHAVLLDAAGRVLSACRFGGVLIGGGGNSALIPGGNLRFEFD